MTTARAEPAPGVTVIVAFHNRADYLEEAIRSVLAEPYAGIDVVLVDDGSTDRAPEVAAGFGPPTRVVRQDQAGCAQAWNTGLEHARGDFVAFCDSDDLWEPGRTAALLAPFRADPATAVVFGHMTEFVSPELDPASLAVRAPHTDVVGPLAGAMVARRSVFDEVGLFNPALRQGYWVDWYARLRERSPRTVIVPQVVLRRRLHATNSSVVQRELIGEFAHVLHASLKRRRTAP